MKICRISRPYLAVAGLCLTFLFIIACGGAQEAAPPASTAPPGASGSVTSQGIEAVIVSSDLAVGDNRFVVGLVDPDQGGLVVNAQLHFRLFKLADGGGSPVLRSEVDAQPLTLEKNYTHVHEDGTLETHGAGNYGVYVATAGFDQPGLWGVEITGTLDGQPLPALTPSFQVREESLTLGIGEPAPRSVQVTLSDVEDIFEIDTSNPADPHMHEMTIAKAVTSGRPTVIVIATPGFCVSQTCGPTKDIVDELYQQYQGRANFVHVEPYDLEKARSGQGLEVLPFLTEEWGIPTEPWVFLIDKDGNIATKFEGVVGLEELETALAPLLSSSPGY